MADLVIQRIVFPLNRNVSALYCRLYDESGRAVEREPDPTNRRSFVLHRGERLDANTYFNSFFEAYWRHHTTLGKLVLRLRLSGKGAVRLRRTSTDSGSWELAHADFDGENQTVELEVPGPRVHPCEIGAVSFDVVARSDSVIILSGDWVAVDAAPKPVKLVAGYCTFDREKYLLDNIKALADDEELGCYLARTIVVDQGNRKVKSHPDYESLPARAMSTTLFLEQANFGGAGGFTRCIIEAMRLHDATHIIVLDDDAIVEPESVFRTATFFSLANRDFTVGGSMLDLLRPTEMYEAGGYFFLHNLTLKGGHKHLSLVPPQNIVKLAELQYAHYNAWWFYAFPLSLAKQHGLPLPFFIRGDDVEYNCRLNRAGIPTITLPGVAVWHVPFYLKERGWVDYYYWRNMLAIVAVHFSMPPRAIARLLFHTLLHHLLTLNYFRAWTISDGVADFLAGPSFLQNNPSQKHTQVIEAYRRLSPGIVPKSVCVHIPDALETSAMPPQLALLANSLKRPRLLSRIRRRLVLLKTMLRHALRATPDPRVFPSVVVNVRNENWFDLRHVDVVAVDEPYEEGHVVLRRSRSDFRSLFSQGARTILRLLFTYNRVANQWRAEMKNLTSMPFWCAYLGIPAIEPHEEHPELARDNPQHPDGASGTKT